MDGLFLLNVLFVQMKSYIMDSFWVIWEWMVMKSQVTLKRQMVLLQSDILPTWPDISGGIGAKSLVSYQIHPQVAQKTCEDYAP